MSNPQPPQERKCYGCGKPEVGDEKWLCARCDASFYFHESGQLRVRELPPPERGTAERALRERLKTRIYSRVNRGAEICAEWVQPGDHTAAQAGCGRCGYTSDMHLLRDILAAFPAQGAQPETEPRCKHGGVIDGAYECPDCVDPVTQSPLSAAQRLRRWLQWAGAVIQPLGVGALDGDMRQGITLKLSAPPDPGWRDIRTQAERIARRAHEGQKDTVTGADYIEHVERVVARVQSDDAKAVAWLHDVLEDTTMPAWGLEVAGISLHVVTAVELLTRHATLPYGIYIDAIAESGNALAIEVKLADLADHLTPHCPERLRPRYEKALLRLSTPPVGPAPSQEPIITRTCERCGREIHATASTDSPRKRNRPSAGVQRTGSSRRSSQAST